MRKSLVIYDFAPDPSEFPNIWGKWFSFLSVQVLFKPIPDTAAPNYASTLASIIWYMLGEILSLKISLRQGLLSRGWEAGSLSQPMRKEQILYMSIVNLMIWGRRLEDWSNMVAHLAGWRRVTQQGVILYMKEGPCRLRWRTTPLAPVWGWSTTKCAQYNVMSYVTQRHGVDPCHLSGAVYHTCT